MGTAPREHRPRLDPGSYGWNDFECFRPCGRTPFRLNTDRSRVFWDDEYRYRSSD